jgi:hypothetical protein
LHPAAVMRTNMVIFSTSSWFAYEFSKKREHIHQSWNLQETIVVVKIKKHECKRFKLK